MERGKGKGSRIMAYLTKGRSFKVPARKTKQKLEPVCLIIPLCPFVGAMCV